MHKRGTESENTTEPPPPSSAFPKSLFGVVGASLSHSLSPLVHNWGFRRENLPFCYHTFEIRSEDLAAFVLAVRTLPIAGASVTIPYKRAIIPYLEELTEEASATGAVNTLFWRQAQLWGDNTDCQGFLAPLERQGLRPESALVLGAGGAALACIQALRRLAVSRITVTARNDERASTLARRLGIGSLSWEERDKWSADLLINATPLGTSGPLEKETPLPEGGLDGFRHVYDLIYNPLKTRLLEQAESAGLGCLSGLDMFIGQALLQFERWTGRRLPEEELRELLQSRLQRDGGRKARGESKA